MINVHFYIISLRIIQLIFKRTFLVVVKSDNYKILVKGRRGLMSRNPSIFYLNETKIRGVVVTF